MFNDFEDAQKRLPNFEKQIAKLIRHENMTDIEKQRVLGTYKRAIINFTNGSPWMSLLDNIDCKAIDYDVDTVLDVLYANPLTWRDGQPVDEEEHAIRDGIESALLFVEIINEY